MKKQLYILVIIFGVLFECYSQEMPSIGENFAYMSVFGNESDKAHGDDDFSQTIFVLIPKSYIAPFFIRIYDPEIYGDLDEVNGAENNTTTSFSVYGGKKAFTEEDAQKNNPVGNYKSGIKLKAKTFGSNPKYNKKWYSMGPFNPLEGEFVKQYNGYVFKIIIEGEKGDDGNLYKIFLSSQQNNNYAIEGANLFTYEYSIRLMSKKKSIAHLYPFIDQEVTSIKQYNFDFDNDGEIRLYSVSKNGHIAAKSGDNVWKMSEHKVTENERGTSLDLQIIKKGNWNNDMVLYITNQYDKNLPFYSVPIGGVPKYVYKVKLKYQKN